MFSQIPPKRFSSSRARSVVPLEVERVIKGPIADFIFINSMAFLVPRFNCSGSEMVLWMIFCSKGSEEMSAINGLIESGFLPYEPCFQPIQENLWHEDGYRLQKRFYIKGHLFYPGCPCRALH